MICRNTEGSNGCEKEGNLLSAMQIYERQDFCRSGQLQHEGKRLPLGNRKNAADRVYVGPLAHHREACSRVQIQEPQGSDLSGLWTLLEGQISLRRLSISGVDFCHESLRYFFATLIASSQLPQDAFLMSVTMRQSESFQIAYRNSPDALPVVMYHSRFW